LLRGPGGCTGSDGSIEGIGLGNIAAGLDELSTDTFAQAIVYVLPTASCSRFCQSGQHLELNGEMQWVCVADSLGEKYCSCESYYDASDDQCKSCPSSTWVGDSHHKLSMCEPKSCSTYCSDGEYLALNAQEERECLPVSDGTYCGCNEAYDDTTLQCISCPVGTSVGEMTHQLPLSSCVMNRVGDVSSSSEDDTTSERGRLMSIIVNGLAAALDSEETRNQVLLGGTRDQELFGEKPFPGQTLTEWSEKYSEEMTNLRNAIMNMDDAQQEFVNFGIGYYKKEIEVGFLINQMDDLISKCIQHQAYCFVASIIHHEFMAANLQLELYQQRVDIEYAGMIENMAAVVGVDRRIPDILADVGLSPTVWNEYQQAKVTSMVNTAYEYAKTLTEASWDDLLDVFATELDPRPTMQSLEIPVSSYIDSERTEHIPLKGSITFLRDDFSYEAQLRMGTSNEGSEAAIKDLLNDIRREILAQYVADRADSKIDDGGSSDCTENCCDVNQCKIIENTNTQCGSANPFVCITTLPGASVSDPRGCSAASATWDNDVMCNSWCDVRSCSKEKVDASTHSETCKLLVPTERLTIKDLFDPLNLELETQADAMANEYRKATAGLEPVTSIDQVISCSSTPILHATRYESDWEMWHWQEQKHILFTRANGNWGDALEMPTWKLVSPEDDCPTCCTQDQCATLEATNTLCNSVLNPFVCIGTLPGATAQDPKGCSASKITWTREGSGCDSWCDMRSCSSPQQRLSDANSYAQLCETSPASDVYTPSSSTVSCTPAGEIGANCCPGSEVNSESGLCERYCATTGEDPWFDGFFVGCCDKSLSVILEREEQSTESGFICKIAECADESEEYNTQLPCCAGLIEGSRQEDGEERRICVTHPFAEDKRRNLQDEIPIDRKGFAFADFGWCRGEEDSRILSYYLKRDDRNEPFRVTETSCIQKCVENDYCVGYAYSNPFSRFPGRCVIYVNDLQGISADHSFPGSAKLIVGGDGDPAVSCYKSTQAA